MRPIRKILYEQIARNYGGLLIVIFLMLLVVGFDVISPWPFKILIDNVLGASPITPDNAFNIFLLNTFPSREILGFFAVFVYFASTFFLAIVEYWRAIMSKYIIRTLTSDFSKNAFKNLESLAIGFFNKKQIGDYIYRLSYDVSALGELLEEGLLPLVTSGLYIVITTIIMFLISVHLTLLSLIVLPFLAYGLYSFNAYIGYATKRSEFFNSAAFSFIQEALTHLKIIQAFSQEKRESKVFDEKIDTSLESDLALSRLDLLLSLLVGIIIAISYSVIIIYGINSVISGALTTGLLIVFIFYLDNLTNPILSVIYAVTTIKQSYIKVVRMEDFFSEKAHLKLSGKTTAITDTLIKFDHVSLHFDGGKNVLNDLCFDIEPQKRTVIFGANGSGKTTVVNLIMRFVDKPNKGNIFLGGINIQDYDIKSLRDSIAFIPQEISLLSDSIRNNIAFGNPHCSFKDVREAARLAVADEFIEKLKGGYDFKVGEAGTFLSGGQRQRLMLARAFLKKDAKILVFDETLSALDVKTRREVLHNIHHFAHGKTAILISNVFSVVSKADNAIVLDKGKVIYSGPAHRLAKESSLYKMIIGSDINAELDSND